MSKPIIFVFGSNLAGIHGAGAAKYAHEQCHAVKGEGIGRTGRAYAIPTKDAAIKNPLLLNTINHHIQVFLDYADAHNQYDFLVTRIGCGLAGFKDDDIAPLFIRPTLNCIMPIEWQRFIPGRDRYHEEGKVLYVANTP